MKDVQDLQVGTYLVIDDLTRTGTTDASIINLAENTYKEMHIS